MKNTASGQLDAGRAARLCAAAFGELGFDLRLMGELSVALVESSVIRELNNEFRGIDAPTDVLSFEVDGPYGEMIGEIVISPGDVSPEMDLEEVVVHGALHLGGLDHGEDFEASGMAEVQRTVLGTLGG
ncbi:MAG: rRNA maturation RNase YbeY [Rubrobacteraceae bacterium]